MFVLQLVKQTALLTVITCDVYKKLTLVLRLFAKKPDIWFHSNPIFTCKIGSNIMSCFSFFCGRAAMSGSTEASNVIVEDIQLLETPSCSTYEVSLILQISAPLHLYRLIWIDDTWPCAARCRLSLTVAEVEGNTFLNAKQLCSAVVSVEGCVYEIFFNVFATTWNPYLSKMSSRRFICSFTSP